MAQIRESAAAFIQLAKTHGVAVVLLGHVTKAGEVAGPRLLEHMVDAVLLMEGSETAELRLLRSVKNRYNCVKKDWVAELFDSIVVSWLIYRIHINGLLHSAYNRVVTILYALSCLICYNPGLAQHPKLECSA